MIIICFTFSEFINIVSILYYAFIEYIMLLHTVAVISFVQCKEHVIWLIAFGKVSDEFTAFTCAGASTIFEGFV